MSDPSMHSLQMETARFDQGSVGRVRRAAIKAAALPDDLREFVAASQWTFAKTMPEWPHEYIVRGRVDGRLFEALVRHIRENGFEARFYGRTLTYFAEGGLLYWTMGAPIEETTIINRCRQEGSYENRLRNGTLPPDHQPR